MSEQIFKEPYMEQSPSYHPNVKDMNPSFDFSQEDKDVLKELAEQVAEIAARPEMQAKKKLWADHNDLKTDQPVVFASPEVGWNEIFPPSTYRCKNPLARTWENTLRHQIHTANVFKDDTVVEEYFDVPYSFSTDGWGLEVIRAGSDKVKEGGAFKLETALEDYERDFEKLHFPTITIDKEQSAALMQAAEDSVGGVLKVRRHMLWHWDTSFVDQSVLLRGMEPFMMDFIRNKDYLHKMMRMITDGMLKRLDWMEDEGLLNLNNDSTYTGTGGQGWTNQLPAPDFSGKVRTKDQWVGVQSQETVSVNPKMYGEFILPYQKEITARFGLACVGCCEPNDKRWQYVKQLPNLRRVSWSPWADPARVPELLGKDFVACIKPSPTPLASGDFDEAAMKADAKRAVEGSKGGICEFIMKDNHTLGGDGSRIVKWVETIRREIDRVYG